LGVNQTKGDQKMKRIGLTALMMFLLFTGLVGCNLSKQMIKYSENDVYSLSIISMGDVLAQTQSNQVSTSMETTDEPVTEDPITDTDPVLEKYLLMVETFLNTSAPLAVIEQASDRVEYQFMSIYQAKDALGNIVNYTVYFNEVEIASEIEDEIEDETENQMPNQRHNRGGRNHDHDDLFDDEENDEIVTELEGLLIVNGTEYTLLGRKEVEGNEIEYKFIALIDELNFIRISFETEDDEQKFKFVQMTDGVIINRTSIKLETEDGESKVMLVYQTETLEARYSFKYADNEDYDLFIKYEIKQQGSEIERGMIKITILVDEVTGETSYTYQIVGQRNGHAFGKDNEIGRGHHGHGRDDDKDNDQGKRP
jgi:hypothetical protein